ncbi:MAG: hypothetical protein U0359_05270 [Byssovorax sp.]
MNKTSSLPTHRLLHLSALPLFALAGVLAGACGGGGSSSTGTGGSAATTTSTTTGSTTATTGTGGTGGADTTSTTGTGGSPKNPDPCDPIAQDCVESVASKCVFHLDDANAATSKCEAPLGHQMLGETCQRPTNETGVDDCEKGLYCSGIGLPKSSPQARTCRTLCNDVGSCGEGSLCLPLDGDRTIGFCAKLCDPFDPSACADPTLKCDNFTNIDGNAGPSCQWVGPKGEGESCASPADCQKGLTCNASVCSRFCNDAHLCPGADEHCSANPFATWPLTPALGACQVSDYTCLGAVSLPDAPAATVELHLLVADPFTGDILPGATVKACDAGDLACAAPLSQGVAGADGSATLTVPTPGKGFEGYFQGEAPGRLPGLLKLDFPISTEASLGGFFMTLMKADQLETSMKGNTTIDPSRGVILALAFDCGGAAAGGTSFAVGSADAQTVLGHGLPSSEYYGVHADCIDPAAASSQTGIAISMNVPPGMTTVSVSAPGAKALGQAQAPVRAGATTTVILFPAP